MAERYEFSFSWEGPYGLIARLLQSHVPPGGTVLDLGCGFGSVAEALRDMGYEYVGLDVEPKGLENLTERGFEAHRFDLRDLDGLGERLLKIVAGRVVGAVLMLDVLEHLPEPKQFLPELRACLVQLDRPLLGLSVPNAAHFDVGAKLVMGSWDVTESGLLDETHVQFFTEHRLLSVLRSFGWFEIARDDFLLHRSDQHFPVDHPALAEGTPLRNLLWQQRRRIGDGFTVNQFVRLFTLTSTAIPPPEVTEPAGGRFLSVLMRTQGLRMHNLMEALTCLAAQQVDDFDVHLLVHSSRQSVFEEVRELVRSFAPSFSDAVHLHQVPEGGRARPLNVGLGAAAGRYVAFLDDDDLVTADWVERFRDAVESNPGQVIRSVTVDRRVSRNNDARYMAPFRTLSGLETTHSPHFNALEHFSRNRTPICSFAVPMEAVRSLGISFDEGAAVLEDWNFLLNLALVCGVHDTRQVTSIYHRWEDASCSSAVATVVWETTHRSIVQRLDAGPLLLPPGCASQIALLWEKALILDHEMPLHNAERANLRDALSDAGQRIAELEGQRSSWAEERARLDREVALARTDAADVRASTTWRLSAPLRRAAWLARRAGSVALRRPRG